MKQLILISIFLLFVNSVDAQGTILYKFKTGGAIYSSASLSGDMVLIGSADSNMYALGKKSGQLLWKFKTNGQVNSTPCVWNEKIIFNSTDGNIYAVNKKSGILLWNYLTRGEQRYDLWDYYLSSPIVDDGIVYIGSGDSSLYALNAEKGTIIWSYKTHGIIHASPIIKDSIIYIGSYDGCLYALHSKTGKLIWKFKTVGDRYFPKGEIQKAAAWYNNTVIFGSRDYNIYAVDSKTGRGVWNRKEKGGWVIATPLVYNDNIFFGTSDSHKFYNMDAGTGEIKWALQLNMRVYGTASLAYGKITFGCFNGKVFMADPVTGHIQTAFQSEENKKGYYSIYTDDDKFRSDFKLYDTNYRDSEKRILSLGSILSDIVVEDKTVYFGDTNGWFYALKMK